VAQESNERELIGGCAEGPVAPFKPSFKYLYELKPGQVVHFGGYPYEYVGGGFIAGNTNPVDTCTCKRFMEENPGAYAACPRCAEVNL
jgi:hypothetical protein